VSNGPCRARPSLCEKTNKHMSECWNEREKDIRKERRGLLGCRWWLRCVAFVLRCSSRYSSSGTVWPVNAARCIVESRSFDTLLYMMTMGCSHSCWLFIDSVMQTIKSKSFTENTSHERGITTTYDVSSQNMSIITSDFKGRVAVEGGRKKEEISFRHALSPSTWGRSNCPTKHISVAHQ
jgi:hypothetical protein